MVFLAEQGKTNHVPPATDAPQSDRAHLRSITLGCQGYSLTEL